MVPPLTGHPAHIAYCPVGLDQGDHDGTAETPGGVGVTAPVGLRDYADPYAPLVVPRSFAYASWTSPEVRAGFVFGELVPTWHARTPGATWVEVEARARSAKTRLWSRWHVLARWADHDATVRPSSVPDVRALRGDIAKVDTDTLLVPDGADAWQLRITLLRPEDTGVGPTLTYVGAMTSSFMAAPRGTGPTSCPPPLMQTGPAAGQVLEVPALSQRIHAGRHPEWGGGDVWCSPTSLAMILAFWGTGPDNEALAWVNPTYPDRSVYHAVRHCWDHAYDGAGNWSFNTAYAARFGLSSFVTRLRDLSEAEAFIAAGIPLVASVRIDPATLTGADYASAGHLVVISGFTAAGDVVVNDPAARDPATVRRVYRRAEFEHAWRRGSGGIVYVIHPPAIGLPRRPAEPNW